MKIGISYWYGHYVPVEEGFEIIAKAGFDTVSFMWMEGDDLRESMPLLAREAGLIVENIHTDFSDANNIWVDDENGEAIFQRYMESVDACARHGIPVMVLHLSSGDNPPKPNEVGLGRLKNIVKLAEQKNVDVALENLRKPEYLDYVYSNIESDKLKFCYDVGHENCHSKNWDLIEKHADKIAVLHLHNNDGKSDWHKPLFEGTIDWKMVVEKLKKAGYNGSLHLEVSNEGSVHKDLSAEEFLAEMYEQAKKLRDMF